MRRRCVVCGAEFDTPPSNNKLTCCKACSAIRRAQTHKGKSNQWAEGKREAARQAAARTGNLQYGSAAALKRPDGQRGPEHREAKVWYLRSPEGKPVVAVNLLDWAREHAADDFGVEPTDANAARIASGFRQIKRSMEGKRYRNGKLSPVSTYKGWTLAAWADKNKDVPD